MIALDDDDDSYFDRIFFFFSLQSIFLRSMSFVPLCKKA